MPTRNPEFEGQVHAPDFPAHLPWLNTAQPLGLRDLRGKLVLLDFWTYCCINCMHILPDLQRLERKYANQLVVIGVHSAKFINEERGLAPLAIVTAAMRKLLHLVFGVVKSGKEFDPNHALAS